MNPKTFGGSIWLLLFGAASVLLIGAFTRFDRGGQPDGAAATAPAPLPAAAGVDSAGPDPSPAVASAGVPLLPSDLSPGLAEIIKLAQAHIADDTILAYIQNSGQTYNPSADEILYLSDLGLSDKIVAALFKNPDGAPADIPAPAASPAAVAAPETPPAPAPGSPLNAAAPDSMIDVPPAAAVEEPPPLQNPQDSYFYDSLAPYGSWVQTADGWAWQPMVASVDANWLPYRDRGQWVLTDDGWYWASDYSWGWAPFHYGRWSHDGRFGWVWVPGHVWAPAWVAWRNTTDGFAGWAALPPGVLLQPGVGLFAGAGLGGFNVSFGLSASWFTFVPHSHFLARNPGRFAAPASRAAALFKSSTPVNNYSFSGRRILNLGVSAEQIAAATKAAVPKLAIKEVSSPAAAGGRSAGQSLAVFRPNPAAPAVRSSPEKPAQPVFINKRPRPATTEAAMPRAVSARPATVASDFAVQAPRPARTALPPRPGFISSNFQPPAVRATPFPAAPAAPAGGWPSLTGGGEVRHIPSPSGPAPAAGYPSYSPRGLNPAPPSVPGTAPAYNAPPHNSPGYSAPSYSAPPSAPPHSAPASAPAESHGGGGGQSSPGGGSAGSASSSTPSKTSK
jgi:hypothetical protein